MFVLLFFLQILEHRAVSYAELFELSNYLLEHRAVSYAELFELSNYFDSPVQRRPRVMYCYSGGDSVRLRNRELQTRETRRLSIRLLATGR